jgi:PAS domain S-box-containing protein
MDITDRKNAENALSESEEKYKSLVNSMVHGVIYQDANRKIIAMNPAAEEILGITFEQFNEIAYKDERWKALKLNGKEYSDEDYPITRVFETGEKVLDTVMGVFNPKKNKTVWIKVNAIPQFRNGEDKPYQVYATFDDITDHIEKK